MRGILLVVLLLLAGCGVRPSGVTDAGDAPTGLAPGVTLYFVDGTGALRPQLRGSGHLGSVTEAVSLLLTGPGSGGDRLHTEIQAHGMTRVIVTTVPEALRIILPLDPQDVTPRGADQIVCTALGVHVQSGGSRRTAVQLGFVHPAPGSEAPRHCPLIT
ncbi:hypothetical protein [Amycolatopsis dongchuanensis]|uniref:Lipoprotein n=1 Tax=Amycolatopsis dongchuanensis TaxID=1070866 RepID=A0ABP8VJX8_9PSEU